MKPIIGIIARPHTTYTGREAICALDDYRKAISNSGGIPIVILPTQNISYESTRPKDAKKLTEEEKQDLIRQINLCDGIIIPGGNRIYDYDIFTTQYVLENNFNVLGICMGIQLIASVSCFEKREDVIQKIESNINHNQINEKYVHNVKIKDDTLLYKLIGKKEAEVNSRHKYSITKVGKEFKINAISEDGFIEGIEKIDKNVVLGLQWHPESMESYDKSMKNIFEFFIEKCTKQ